MRSRTPFLAALDLPVHALINTEPWSKWLMSNADSHLANTMLAPDAKLKRDIAKKWWDQEFSPDVEDQSVPITLSGTLWRESVERPLSATTTSAIRRERLNCATGTSSSRVAAHGCLAQLFAAAQVNWRNLRHALQRRYYLPVQHQSEISQRDYVHSSRGRRRWRRRWWKHNRQSSAGHHQEVIGDTAWTSAQVRGVQSCQRTWRRRRYQHLDSVVVPWDWKV